MVERVAQVRPPFGACAVPEDAVAMATVTPARLSRLPSSGLRLGDCSPERVWTISTARLCTLPYLHLQPINVVVFDGPYVEILS